MGIKEKEHEEYFLGKGEASKLLPVFEKLFKWGRAVSTMLILKENMSLRSPSRYCKE